MEYRNIRWDQKLFSSLLTWPKPSLFFHSYSCKCRYKGTTLICCIHSDCIDDLWWLSEGSSKFCASTLREGGRIKLVLGFHMLLTVYKPKNVMEDNFDCPRSMERSIILVILHGYVIWRSFSGAPIYTPNLLSQI